MCCTTYLEILCFELGQVRSERQGALCLLWVNVPYTCMGLFSSWLHFTFKCMGFVSARASADEHGHGGINIDLSLEAIENHTYVSCQIPVG